MIATSNVSPVSWPLGCLDQAAVDEVVVAGDVGGPAGGQEGDQRGDLFWGSEPAGGEPADPGEPTAVPAWVPSDDPGAPELQLPGA
jgi:hypothetical protein